MSLSFWSPECEYSFGLGLNLLKVNCVICCLHFWKIKIFHFAKLFSSFYWKGCFAHMWRRVISDFYHLFEIRVHRFMQYVWKIYFLAIICPYVTVSHMNKATTLFCTFLCYVMFFFHEIAQILVSWIDSSGRYTGVSLVWNHWFKVMWYLSWKWPNIFFLPWI